MPWSWSSNLQGPQGPAGPQGPKGLTLIHPAAGEKVPLLYAASALTVLEVRALVAGTSPSAGFSIRYGADFSGSGTEVQVGGMTAISGTTGDSWTALDNGVLPPGTWLWLVMGAVGGTVSSLHVALLFDG
jgi:hypothetical protein